ncbi:MAG: RNA polymerase sigma factor [Myxococcales bacterium]|nr:RNA polymerase sigma factor [Myxococcales bacterium]MDD9970744.1 RNA polymerase sigma factor [Myxococcales bacterium]
MSAGEHLDSSELFRRYARYVANFLVRMGVPGRDLDDLMQEVFLVAHKHGGYTPGPAKPTTYLANIAFKAVVSHRRKARTRGFVSVDERAVEHAAAGSRNAEAQREHDQKLEILDRVLGTLDEDKRAVFVMAELQGETVVSIAAGLGVPVDTAYSRLRAARKKFRAAVLELGAEQAEALSPSLESTPQ